MCRWLGYCGPEIAIADLVFDVDNSLIDQAIGHDSLRPADKEVNADGFGVGWYDDEPVPGLYRTIRPAWNDFNGRDLAAHVKSPMFMAHVRSATTGAVQETNCHPFRYKDVLFVHNGEIARFQELRRDLMMYIDRDLFPHIQGTTDSEVLFYLLLAFGLEDEPQRALTGAISFIERTAVDAGIGNVLDMTIGLSTTKGIFVSRYATAGDGPTLYATSNPEHLFNLNPALVSHPQSKEIEDGKFRLIVSEPIGDMASDWEQIENGESVFFDRTGREVEVGTES